MEAAAPVILTENTRLALALLSAEFFGHPARDLTMIGITGTKGKTTTAFMLRSMLEAAGRKTGVIGTIGVLYGDRLFQTENTTPESSRCRNTCARWRTRLRGLRDGGLLNRPARPPRGGLHVRPRPFYELFRGSHRRRGAQGHVGVHGLQKPAVPHVPHRRHQH